MKVIHLSKVKKYKVGAPIFTSSVGRQSPLASLDGSSVSVDYIYFPKGVRNKFHSHSHDQTLIVTKGSGIVATKSKKYQVKAGDIIWIPKGEVHWHGATSRSSFTHISVTPKGTTIKVVGK